MHCGPLAHGSKWNPDLPLISLQSLPHQAASRGELTTWSWCEVPGLGPLSRGYALLTLSNGMRILIASDETLNRMELASKSGAGAIDILLVGQGEE